MANKTRFYIKLAEVIIEINSLYKECRSRCADYEVKDIDSVNCVDFVVDIVPRNIKRENFEFQIHNKNKSFLYYDPGYLEYFAVQRKISELIPKHGAFLIHGAVVEYEGIGVMFTAQSGVGKSTRTRLFLEEYPGSIVVNGDKPFLKLKGNNVYAFGSPWCGKEKWNTNIGVPLKAILLLERADDGEKSSINELPFEEVYLELLNHVYIPNDPESLYITLKLLKELNGKVKVYRFRSTNTHESIRYAWESII